MKTKNNLEAWLTDSRFLEYAGKEFELKLAVFGAVLSGEKIADVARRNNVTRQSANKLAIKARRILCQSQVD